MKKTYKNPSLTVVKIQAARILAGSDPKYYDTTTTTLTSGNHGRASRFSDDDWEE